MGPIPDAARSFKPEDWPERNEDGSITLAEKPATRLAVTLTTLLQYVTEEHAECGDE